jgi:hypothetical protein
MPACMRTINIRCVSALRGLAVDEDCRRLMVRRGALGPLLSIAKRAASTNKHLLELRRAEREAEKKAEREEYERSGGEASSKSQSETKKKKKTKVLSAGRVWDKDLEMETIGCLLNISLSGCIGENPVRFLQVIMNLSSQTKLNDIHCLIFPFMFISPSMKILW